MSHPEIAKNVADQNHHSSQVIFVGVKEKNDGNDTIKKQQSEDISSQASFTLRASNFSETLEHQLLIKGGEERVNKNEINEDGTDEVPEETADEEQLPEAEEELLSKEEERKLSVEEEQKSAATEEEKLSTPEKQTLSTAEKEELLTVEEQKLPKEEKLSTVEEEKLPTAEQWLTASEEKKLPTVESETVPSEQKLPKVIERKRLSKKVSTQAEGKTPRGSEASFQQRGKLLSGAPMSIPIQRYSRTLREQNLPNIATELGEKSLTNLEDSGKKKIKSKEVSATDQLKTQETGKKPVLVLETGEKKFSEQCDSLGGERKLQYVETETSLSDKLVSSNSEDLGEKKLRFGSDDADKKDAPFLPSKDMRLEYGRSPKTCEKFLTVEEFSKLFVEDVTEEALSKGRDVKQQSLIKIVEGITYKEDDEDYSSAESYGTYVCMLEWPTIQDFTIELGMAKIDEYISYWKMEEDWKHCVDFLKAQSDSACDFYHYEAIFSIPCKQYPIPQATASVFFTFEASRIRPKHCLVDLHYIFEGQRLVYIPGRFTFHEERLFHIVDAKIKFYRTLTF